MPFVINKMFAKEKTRAFLYLVKELGYTQKEAQRMISKGRLLIDGEAMTKSSTEIEGEFELIEFQGATRGLKPVFENDNFVVFNKPSGVLIHPQSRYTEYSLVDELRYQYGKEANITHRIDQETSGIVLCAKSKQAEIDIKYLFENRLIQKTYIALVHGKFEKEMVVEEPLLRTKHDDTQVRTVVIVSKDGKKSKTTLKPLEYFEDLDMTLVEAKPHTGRQHQIRVHLFHVKHPIVGDPIYGETSQNIVKYFDKTLTNSDRLKFSKATRLLLHADMLEFELYGKEFQIESKVDIKNEFYSHVKSHR